MNIDLIHERARLMVGEGWAQCIDGKALCRIIDYHSIIYENIFTAAAVELQRKQFVEAARLYRNGEHEKAADMFFSAAIESCLVEDPDA